MTDPWISVSMPRPEASSRVLCFPHAGGGASSFHAWGRALAARPVEVQALRLPGREARLREAPIDDMQALVQEIDAALVRMNDPRPMLWFGHSSGARIAFELARHRRAAGRPLPYHLVVSGAPAPDVPRAARTLHRIEDDGEFVEAVARAYGGVPAEVLGHEELRLLIAPALRADLRLHERYVYTEEEPLAIPITAFGGLSDGTVSEAWLRRWSRHTTGAFAWHMVPGDHFYLHEAGARSVLLRALAPVLETVRT